MMALQFYKSYSRRRWQRFYSLVLLLLICTFSLRFVSIDVSKFNGALGIFFKVITEDYLHPNLDYVRNTTFLNSFIESIKMTFLGWSIGIIVSLPIAVVSAYSINKCNWMGHSLGRALFIVARSVHEMIWAILFVSVFGYGPLAGSLALVMMTIGFAGKLFVEEIDTVSMKPIEAIQAAGASMLQVVVYGALPQIKGRLLGISVYAIDNAFRASTILGFFGAGGMGTHLRETTQTLAYSETAAILLFIVFVVSLSEILSASFRYIIKASNL